jgi:allantoicase
LSKFALDGYTVFASVLDNAFCKGNVFFEWKVASVNHDACESAVDCVFANIEIGTVVKMQCDRYFNCLDRSLDKFAQIRYPGIFDGA